MSERVIYQVGYRGWTIAALAGRVKELDAVLVDVRRSTGRPQGHWSTVRFSGALGERYRWLPALGNRNYKDATAPIELVNEAKGMEQLRSIVKSATVVIMCACEEYELCHRRVVIETFQRYGGKLIVKPLERSDSQGKLW